MNLATLVHALVDEGADFVIIGGWCAILHGSSYLTNDLDVCFSRTRENTTRIARALAPFRRRPRDFPPELPFQWDDATLRNGTIFTLSTTLGYIDLLAEVSGLGEYGQVKANSIQVVAFDRQVCTLDLPGLIKSKRAAGREKDLRSLPELESLLEAGQEPG